MTDNERSENEKSDGMDRIAKTLFAPIYPVLAGYFLDRFGRRDGVCIDLGSGPGSLAIAVAQSSSMMVWALDKSEDAVRKMQENIAGAGLTDRITPLHGDVVQIPLPDTSVDLVVSRGSIFFWEDVHAAFCETARILRPGGMAFIGGGFGSAELRDQIVVKMMERRSDWEPFYRKNMSPETVALLNEELARTNGVHGEVIRDDSGIWVVMRK
ncbi:MAG: class I SAM-dependent methyltransferase [Methanomicrobiales archaeon]|nr:class I SAM-dependent methyltransferase [Methanomicrobiales archaeon]